MIINYFFTDLNIFFRGIGATTTSLILTIILGKPFIWLVKKYVQPIRTDGPETHLDKQNTATFGGILIIIVFLISLIFWCNFNRFVLMVVFGGLSFAIIGLIDDTLKLIYKNPKGLNGKLRLILGFIIGLILAFFLYNTYSWELFNKIYWPFLIDFCIPISWLYFFWVPWVIIGTANSVNLTDGLDGLASLTVSVVILAFAIIAVIISNPYYYNSFVSNYYYLKIPWGELFIVGLALFGVLLGFLWYNGHPASLFMGDVGSLFLGGTLGSLAITLKHEIVLMLAGIIFMLEALSVIVQVYFFKITKKRIFLMAPLHHHFEKMGFKEITIVNKFWLITIVASLLSLLLSLYKI